MLKIMWEKEKMFYNVLKPFIFQLRDYPSNITHDIYTFFFNIPWIFLEHECIFCDQNYQHFVLFPLYFLHVFKQISKLELNSISHPQMLSIWIVVEVCCLVKRKKKYIYIFVSDNVENNVGKGENVL